MQQQQQIRANRIVTVGNVTSVTHATTTPTTGLPIDWPNIGRVLWIVGSVRGATSNDNYVTGMSSLAFRIDIAGVQELVTNGSAGDFLVFSEAFPSAGFRMPISREVKQRERWFVYFANYHTGTDFTPHLSFGFYDATQK